MRLSSKGSRSDLQGDGVGTVHVGVRPGSCTPIPPASCDWADRVAEESVGQHAHPLPRGRYDLSGTVVDGARGHRDRRVGKRDVRPSRRALGCELRRGRRPHAVRAGNLCRLRHPGPARRGSATWRRRASSDRHRRPRDSCVSRQKQGGRIRTISPGVVLIASSGSVHG